MHKTNIIILFPFIYNNTNNNNTDDRNSKIIPGLAWVYRDYQNISNNSKFQTAWKVYPYQALKVKSR